MPVLWPVAHVTTALTKPKDDKAGPNVSLGKLDLVGHLTAFCAALRSFSLAYVAIYWLYDGYDYPAFGGGTLGPDDSELFRAPVRMGAMVASAPIVFKVVGASTHIFSANYLLYTIKMKK